MTGWPSPSVPSGSLREVDVGRAGERVGHHQRRRGEVVGLHVGVDAALEVAVAGEHGRGHQLAVVDRLATRRRAAARCCRCRSCSRSRPGGSRAPRGRCMQARLLQVLGHHLRARAPGWSSRSGGTFSPRATALRASRPAPEHHRRVRGVGAARDGGDHHRAVAELAPCSPSQLDAAPCARRSSAARPKPRSLTGAVSACAERRLHLRERHAVLRPLRPGEARLDRRRGRARACR